ncbi:unnamed protein product [Caenorhabditis sp. 36 PRJEB53466]|nr:unnamed protein product [Caenorhabditis sp. 36 PRJEB53466]
MGGSQSATSSRAAKFSGNGASRRSVRSTRSAPATELNARRATSCRNTNRNVKEFSKFWSDAGSVSRSKSSNRASTKRPNGTTNGVSIRRNRTQSVDVRRTSNCLPIPGTPSNCSASPRINPRRSASFRSNASVVSSTLSVNGERRKSRNGSTCELTLNSGRSEVYSAEFNQAAIAAARLKRLSLTPYPVEPIHSHHRSSPSPQSVHQNRQHNHYHQRPPYQKSPETAIY